jgi:SAM-dependent methyltransferase
MNLEQFYDNWYAHGYMDEWPPAKKQRVYELIVELNLPASGKALDFGCGNGVFTDVVKKALPGWQVYGSDLSRLAIENANKRFPDCTFLFADAVEFQQMQFDFVFSHHVLEHVDDKSGTAALIAKFAAPNASMLHILPCGNKGSFEYRICSKVKNGIQISKGDTFFFEEEMHLQRFTSAGLSELFRIHGFQKKAGFYANQYVGALQWISGMSKQFILHLTDYKRGVNFRSRLYLFFYRCLFTVLYYIQRPSALYSKDEASMNAVKKVLYRISCSCKEILNRRAQREWRLKRANENGSEMYLYFQRVHTGS